MSRGTSSANPDQLLRYSEISRELDVNLRSTASRLQAQLEHFEARCVEPGFRLHVSGQAAVLQQSADENEAINAWIREIGSRFQAADGRWGKANSRWLGSLFSKAWSVLLARASPGLSRVINFLALLTVPNWLREQTTTLSWTMGSDLTVQDTVMSEVSSVDDPIQGISTMSLSERWQWLERVQAKIEIHLQELADLRVSGANEHLSAADLEQRIAILRERQTKLQLEADNWFNKVWISEQGLKPGFDDGPLDAPWRTRSDDLEDQIAEIADEIAEVEALLPHQRAYDHVATELRMAENTKQSIETFLAENWWNDVPLISQQGLQYRGYNTNYGCVPTATAMVLEYWHGRNPANKTMSAQELLDKNVAQGQFTASGMSPAEIHDEVQSLGYTHAPDMDVSFEKLKTIVMEGPIIAVVKMGMRTSGINHVVVITGISPDGLVRVNDPWSGQALTYTREEFMRSWGADFGSGYHGHNITVIRPS